MTVSDKIYTAKTNQLKVDERRYFESLEAAKEHVEKCVANDEAMSRVSQEGASWVQQKLKPYQHHYFVGPTKEYVAGTVERWYNHE